jgi:hypothetical protein
MADNDDKPPLMPPCAKCGGETTFYRRVLDPEKSITYELFDCAPCALTTVGRTARE